MDESDLLGRRTCENHEMRKPFFKPIEPAEPGVAVTLGLDQIFVSCLFLSVGPEVVLQPGRIAKPGESE